MHADITTFDYKVPSLLQNAATFSHATQGAVVAAHGNIPSFERNILLRFSSSELVFSPWFSRVRSRK